MSGSVRIGAIRRQKLCSIAILAFASLSSIAQESPMEPPAAEKISDELIQTRLKEAEATEGLDDATKAKIPQLYQQARQELQNAQKSAEQIAAFDRMIETAADELRTVRRELESPSFTEARVPAKATPAILDQMLAEQEALLVQAKDELAALNAEPTRRQNRLLELPKLVEAAQQRLAEVEKQIVAPAPPGEHPQLTLARQTNLHAQREALQKELQAYEKEKNAYAATTDLLPLQRDLKAEALKASEANVARLRKAATRERQRDVDQLVDDALTQVEQAPQHLKSVAEQTLAYAEQNQKLAARIEGISSDLQRTQAALDSTKADFTRTREKVTSIGLTDALGVMLRSERDNLVKIRKQFRPRRGLRTEIRDLHLELMELDDVRADLATLDDQVSELLRRAPHIDGDFEREQLEQEARDSFDRQRKTLDALIQNHRTIFERLVALDSAQYQLTKEIDAYNAYIEERILWIRSAGILGPQDAPRAAAAATWLVSPGNWLDAGRALLIDAGQSWFLYVITALLWMLLALYQRRLRNDIRHCGEVAARRGCQQFLPTLRAFGATLLIAFFWPMAFLVVGWRLWASGESSDFARALGTGVMIAAVFYFSMEILRQLVRNKGLADAHFDWAESARVSLRRNVRWLSIVATPLVLVMVTLQQQDEQEWRGSLGRISGLTLLLLLACFAHFVFRPKGVFISQWRQDQQGGWMHTMRYVWYAILVGGPLVLAGVAVMGYYYTSVQIIERAHTTMWLMISCYLLMALVLRGFLVRRRRLAMQQARERREAAHAAAAAGEKPVEAAGITVEAEPEINLTAISQQSWQLMRLVGALVAVVGLFAIWSDILPALKLLNDVTLWRVSIGERVEAVTLNDLLLSLVVFVVMIVAVKNIPGLLELLLLQRLPLDAGARYAVTTIFRYVLTLIGVIVALTLLHIQWSDYGWLIAAAMVGLGFGLQEIFANFVSGLIILLERPIRVGDVVTVDNVTGVVSRIQMRATTVTNWDRQELVVPNKEFVTGRLLNWTLSNPVNRIVVNVGVAYGSDTKLARELLLKIAREHPDVLKDPEPIVTFEQFGDNSLNFVLRCYLPSLDKRLPTINALHTTIDNEFRAARIEIAFPQRDLHIRSVPESLLPRPTKETVKVESSSDGNGKHTA